MELRMLEYFLAVMREGSISNAAKALHVTQPTLSRQLAALEKEFGCELYVRGPQGVEPTERGIMLGRYAESIMDLAGKAERDMLAPEKSVSGIVHIGAGESQAMCLIAQAMAEVQKEYPGVSFAIHSGTTADLKDGLVRGFYDVMLECEMRPHAKMNAFPLPVKDRWGAIALKDSRIGCMSGISPDDLADERVIASRQALSGVLRQWAGSAIDAWRVSATFNLPMNAKYLVRQGMGCLLTYEGLFELGENSDLRFVPFDPAFEVQHGLVWRAALPNRQTQVFIDAVKRLSEQYENLGFSSFTEDA